MKENFDKSMHVKHTPFKVGDHVLFKWPRTNKHQPLFNPAPYKITSVNGTMITANNENHSITRNASCFRTTNHQTVPGTSKSTTQTEVTYWPVPNQLITEPLTPNLSMNLTAQEENIPAQPEPDSREKRVHKRKEHVLTSDYNLRRR